MDLSLSIRSEDDRDSKVNREIFHLHSSADVVYHSETALKLSLRGSADKQGWPFPDHFPHPHPHGCNRRIHHLFPLDEKASKAPKADKIAMWKKSLRKIVLPNQPCQLVKVLLLLDVEYPFN